MGGSPGLSAPAGALSLAPRLRVRKSCAPLYRSPVCFGGYSTAGLCVWEVSSAGFPVGAGSTFWLGSALKDPGACLPWVDCTELLFDVAGSLVVWV